jgi:hypothetical protein
LNVKKEGYTLLKIQKGKGDDQRLKSKRIHQWLKRRVTSYGRKVRVKGDGRLTSKS